LKSWSGEYRTAPEPPSPYQVVYSEVVKQQLRNLFDVAFTRGDGPVFTAALKEFDRLFRLYPQLGDPQIDLSVEPGVIYLGIIPPLAMRYGVYEDRRLVLVVVPPKLPPPVRPDKSE
jgi:hypothetical protein